MASEFDSLMAAALTHIFDTFGEAATYTPAGGEGVAVTCCLGAADTVVDDMDGRGEMQVETRTITVQLTEVTTPAIGAMITVGSANWLVTAINDITANTAELQCRLVTEIVRHHAMHKEKIRS